jgi:PilZ domain
MRTFGNSHATGRRAVPRGPSSFTATLTTQAGHHQVTLIDVSRTGARFAGETVPSVGEELLFTAEDVKAHADVVWRQGDACAIEFDTPLAVSEVKNAALPGSA